MRRSDPTLADMDLGPRYAVMGNPIAHSLSPIIHQLFGKQTDRVLSFEKILIDLPYFEQQVSEFFSQGGKGLSITLPCKQRAFAMSKKVTARCSLARAANTLWLQEGKLQADNTDGVGLLRDISRYIELPNKSVLVLGAGGAVRGILGPLLEAQPKQLTIVNRTLEKAQLLQLDFPAVAICTYADLPDHLQIATYDVVINATSASLAGENLVLPETLMSTKPVCYDLAYRAKEPTIFVAWARKRGCVATDGLGMLVEQAAEAFSIWHGVVPEIAPVLHFLRSGKKSKI